MTLHIEYQKSKVVQALRYHFISRREIKLMLIAVNVFAILSAALFGFKLIRPLPFLVSSFLWFSLMIVFWFLLPRMVYKRSATFKEKIDFDLRDADILLSTANSRASWKYSDFQYYIESPFFFHLYINDKSFFLLPKDACTGENDTVVVRQWLTDKIGKRK